EGLPEPALAAVRPHVERIEAGHDRLFPGGLLGVGNDGAKLRRLPAGAYTVKRRSHRSVEQLLFHGGVGMAGEAIAQSAVPENLGTRLRVAGHARKRLRNSKILELDLIRRDGFTGGSGGRLQRE